ncbi:MAG: hypothetical protein IKA36_01690, partial [Clostridia bacterium]|nr:hypothetical protein [Clostridia bacterium]
TVDDFIHMRSSDEVTYYNYSILQYLNGIEYLVTNVLYDYEDELLDASVTLTLDEAQYLKYKYKPWLLAYDLYGAVECEFVLMTLNSIIDPKDFDFKRMKAILPNNLSNILGRIYSANSLLLNTNRSDMKIELKKDPNGNTIW